MGAQDDLALLEEELTEELLLREEHTPALAALEAAERGRGAQTHELAAIIVHAQSPFRAELGESVIVGARREVTRRLAEAANRVGVKLSQDALRLWSRTPTDLDNLRLASIVGLVIYIGEINLREAAVTVSRGPAAQC